MSGQSNPSPRPKVTIQQWMTILAVIAVANYLASQLVKLILANQLAADEVRSHTASALLAINGFVLVYVVGYLTLDWWSKVYHHERGLPDRPRRFIVWEGERGLVLGLFLIILHIGLECAQVGGPPRPNPFLSASWWLMFGASGGLSAWIMSKRAREAAEPTRAVTEPPEGESSHPNIVTRST